MTTEQNDPLTRMLIDALGQITLNVHEPKSCGIAFRALDFYKNREQSSYAHLFTQNAALTDSIGEQPRDR